MTPFLLLPLWAKKIAVAFALCGSLVGLHYGGDLRFHQRLVFSGDLSSTRRAIAAGAVELNPLGIQGSTAAVWTFCGVAFLPLAYPVGWSMVPSYATWAIPASQIPFKIQAIRQNNRIAEACAVQPEQCVNGCKLHPELCR